VARSVATATELKHSTPIGCVSPTAGTLAYSLRMPLLSPNAWSPLPSLPHLMFVGVPGRFLAHPQRSMSSKKEQLATVERKLQVLDVSIVDALLHLEALLWRCHSIQRALVRLRNEAPLPLPQVPSRLSPRSHVIWKSCDKSGPC
jgi:hypothetical protein